MPTDRTDAQWLELEQRHQPRVVSFPAGSAGILPAGGAKHRDLSMTPPDAGETPALPAEDDSYWVTLTWLNKQQLGDLRGLTRVVAGVPNCVNVLVTAPQLPGELGELLGATVARFVGRLPLVSPALRFSGGVELPLPPAGRTLVMGIVNVTPDSFSDGGQFATTDAAIAQAERLIEDGADILDIGGESTRPGSAAVPTDEQCRRIVPVIAEMAHRAPSVPISVDANDPEVVEQALAAGARMVNDVTGAATQAPSPVPASPQAPPPASSGGLAAGDGASDADGLSAPGAALARLAVQAGALYVVMHIQGTPRVMQRAPHYDDCVGEIAAALRASTARLVSAGLPRDRIVLDCGFGFGKTLAHNVELLQRLPELRSLGQPLLVGISRKSMLSRLHGDDTDVPVTDRLPESLAAATVAAAMGGASIVRVHDVRETRKALVVADACRRF